MNSKLREALDKAKAIKDAEEQKKLAKWKAEAEASQTRLDSYRLAARKWIEENLYDLIAKEEAQCTYGDKYICLGDSYKDGILSEAIYEEAKTIEGLVPYFTTGAIYENAEYQGQSEPAYYIKWKSEK